jgi:hypothetical protein
MITEYYITSWGWAGEAILSSRSLKNTIARVDMPSKRPFYSRPRQQDARSFLAFQDQRAMHIPIYDSKNSHVGSLSVMMHATYVYPKICHIDLWASQRRVGRERAEREA